jgi:2,6-dihydroxypseudooxynicotine hydrolase
MARDELVQSAIDNWAPRFISNGVDANDFQRVIASVERWDDWCRKWSECGAMHAGMGEEAEANGHYISAATHYFHASISYHFGKYLFMRNDQEYRAAHEQTVRNYRRALPYFDIPGERVPIPYENGVTMYGILRKPWHTPRPPVVILVPGLDSVKEEMHIYGNDFLRRGMAVLAIDGPGQGEMEFAVPLRHDYEVPIRYVIDYLETRPDIDTGHVGLMGVSLGGHFAPRAAAFEARLKATISNCGDYSIATNFEKRPLISRETMIYKLKARDQAEAMQKLQQFNLQGVLAKIQAPLLVISGGKDRLVPSEAGKRIAAEAGREGDKAELWLFEDGNHVCNNIPYKHRPQQADWMHEKL